MDIKLNVNLTHKTISNNVLCTCTWVNIYICWLNTNAIIFVKKINKNN